MKGPWTVEFFYVPAHASKEMDSEFAEDIALEIQRAYDAGAARSTQGEAALRAALGRAREEFERLRRVALKPMKSWDSGYCIDATVAEEIAADGLEAIEGALTAATPATPGPAPMAVKHWVLRYETNRGVCGEPVLDRLGEPGADWVADWSNSTCPACLSHRPPIGTRTEPARVTCGRDYVNAQRDTSASGEREAKPWTVWDDERLALYEDADAKNALTPEGRIAWAALRERKNAATGAAPRAAGLGLREEPCPGCGKHSRITTAGCDHCNDDQPAPARDERRPAVARCRRPRVSRRRDPARRAGQRMRFVGTVRAFKTWMKGWQR